MVQLWQICDAYLSFWSYKWKSFLFKECPSTSNLSFFITWHIAETNGHPLQLSHLLMQFVVLTLDYFRPFVALWCTSFTGAAFTQPVTIVCHVSLIGCPFPVPRVGYRVLKGGLPIGPLSESEASRHPSYMRSIHILPRLSVKICWCRSHDVWLHDHHWWLPLVKRVDIMLALKCVYFSDRLGSFLSKCVKIPSFILLSMHVQGWFYWTIDKWLIFAQNV